MASLYTQLNSTLLQFVTNLQKSFPDDAAVSKNATNLQECIRRDPASVAPYDFLKTGIVSDKKIREDKEEEDKEEEDKEEEPSVVDIIKSKDPDRFFARKRDVPIVAYAGSMAIYKALDEAERKAWWEGLRSLALLTTVISATGDSMSSYQELAHKFVAKNPNLSEEEARQRIFTDILSDPSLSSHLLKAYSDPSSIKDVLQSVESVVSLMGNGMSENLNSMVASIAEDSDDDDSEEDEGEDECEEDKDEEEEEEEEEEEDFGVSSSKVSASAILSGGVSIKKNKKKLNGGKGKRGGKRGGKKNKKKKKTEGFGDVLGILKGMDLDEEDLASVHQGVQDALSGKPIKLDDDGNTIDIGEIMKSIAGSGMTAGPGGMPDLSGMVGLVSKLSSRFAGVGEGETATQEEIEQKSKEMMESVTAMTQAMDLPAMLPQVPPPPLPDLELQRTETTSA